MISRLLFGLLVSGGLAVAGPVFREDFKEVPAHTPVEATDLTCGFLNLKLLGPGAEKVKLSFHPEKKNDPHYLWNGQCEGPVLIAFAFSHELDLSDKGSLVRLRSKNSGKSTLHLAFRVGKQWFMKKEGVSKDGDWTEHHVLVHPGEWQQVEATTLKTRPSLIPDLRKTNAIGFVAPNNPIKSKDCIRLDWFELTSKSAVLRVR